MFHFFNQINTTGAPSGAGTAYPSGARDFTPGFQRGSCYSFCSFMCNVVCPFSFGHCVVCTSSIYRFSLPLWYLQTPFTTFSGLSIFNCLCCILLLYSLTLIQISTLTSISNIIPLFSVFSELRSEVIFRFVDIDGVLDHHCLNFLFLIVIETKKMAK